MQLFHYHLVTCELRDVEARYLGKLGFDLVARYGRMGDEHVSVEPGVSWEQARPRRVQAAALGARARRDQRGRAARSLGSSASRPPRCRSRRRRVPGRARAGHAVEPPDPGARRQPHVRRHERGLPARGPSTARMDRRAARRTTTILWLTELQLRADDPEVKAAALGDLLDARSARPTSRSAAPPSRSSAAAPKAGPSCRRALRLADAGRRASYTAALSTEHSYAAAGVSLATAGVRRRAAPHRRRVDRRDRVRRVRRAASARRRASARRVDRRRRHEADRSPARARPAARLRSRSRGALHQRRAHVRRRPAAAARLRRGERDPARGGRRARRGSGRGLPRGPASRSSAARPPSCPGIYAPGELDFAGTCVGIVGAADVIDGSTRRARATP